jgi:hypothetical protein
MSAPRWIDNDLVVAEFGVDAVARGRATGGPRAGHAGHVAIAVNRGGIGSVIAGLDATAEGSRGACSVGVRSVEVVT